MTLSAAARDDEAHKSVIARRCMHAYSASCRCPVPYLRALIIVPRLVVQHDNNEASVTHHRQMGLCYACKSLCKWVQPALIQPVRARHMAPGWVFWSAVFFFIFCSFYFNKNTKRLWLAKFGRVRRWDEARRREDKDVGKRLEAEQRQVEGTDLYLLEKPKKKGEKRSSISQREMSFLIHG